MSEVTERIQHAIARSGLTQKAVAVRVNISEQYLSDIVNGRRAVSAYVVLGLERVLDMNAQLLLYAQVNEELAAARAEASGMRREVEAGNNGR